jgi:hypothetical protein
LEDAQRDKRAEKEKMMKRKCRLSGCPGEVRLTRITQTFERDGSPVQVIIKNIPVNACQICGESTMTMETMATLDDLLRPFHGSHKNVPKLPPAEVFIDFPQALRAKKAA